jgi:hypothetical protein
MKELAKRWSRVNRALIDGGVAWVLKGKDARWNWAHIQRNEAGTEWQLRIWGVGDWEWVTNIKSLRAAKAAGRILAAKAINF